MTKKLKENRKGIMSSVIIALAMIAFIWQMAIRTHSTVSIEESNHFVIKNDKGEVLYDLPHVVDERRLNGDKEVVYLDDEGEVHRLIISGTYFIEIQPEK